MAAFTITPARYAKGKMLVRTPSDGSGLKTDAMYLIAALGGRWVNRSKGYIMSPAAVAKLEKLHAAGFAANMRLFHDTPASFYHTARGLKDLTAAEALKLA